MVLGGIFSWKQHTAQQMAAAQAAARRRRDRRCQSGDGELATLHSGGGESRRSQVSRLPAVGGQVSTINFNSGEWAKRGALLLELDSRTDQAQLKGLMAERIAGTAQFRTCRQAGQREICIQIGLRREARASLDAAEARVTGQQALIERNVSGPCSTAASAYAASTSASF